VATIENEIDLYEFFLKKKKNASRFMINVACKHYMLLLFIESRYTLARERCLLINKKRNKTFCILFVL